MTFHNRKNVLILLALLYSVSISAGSMIIKNNLVMEINQYVAVIISFFISFKVMRKAISTGDKGILLNIVLGICCLALGNVYFFFLKIVSIVPGTISVGLFAKNCCYLFFIAALLEYKKEAGKRGGLYFYLINGATFVLTAACAYALLANNIYVLNISVLLMDLFCLILAVGLIPNKKARFFACLMLSITLLDVISSIEIFTLSVFLKSLSPLLYLLFARLIDSMKEDVAHAC